MKGFYKMMAYPATISLLVFALIASMPARGGAAAKSAPRHHEGRDAPRRNRRHPLRCQLLQNHTALAPTRRGMRRQTADDRRSYLVICPC